VVQTQNVRDGVIQTGAPHNLYGRTGVAPIAWLRTGLAVALVFVCMAFLPACSGGGGGGGDTQGNASGGGQFEDPNDVPDDRYVDGNGDPNGTGSVPNVVIIRDLPGGDPARDQGSDSTDLGG